MRSRLFDHFPVRLLCVSLLTIGFGLHFCSAQDATQTAKQVDPGQADLDEAVILRIDADSLKELEKVSDLLQSAITKGLVGRESVVSRKRCLVRCSCSKASN